jgi:selenocysteine-specific elongation factor
MIIGTAGHIDHGKTSLVRALTGIETDRLKEEKARGITIELGYAYQALNANDPTGARLGFVDMPGHERFIPTMLAGATGIGFALLVIAADDGVMPQTREHLQILQLLQLQRGAVVLTKIDLVDEARLVQVVNDLHRLLASTFLADAPVFQVSTVTGNGVTELKQYLIDAAYQWHHDQIKPSPASSDHTQQFRLAVDRCFSLEGRGTVVTGTVHAGALRIGDTVRLLSSSGDTRTVTARVRSLHALNQIADACHLGQRVALNLAGLERSAIQRGDWVVAEATHHHTERVAITLSLLPDAKPLKHWTPVHVHCGATHITAHVALLEGDCLAPGASMLAELALVTPLHLCHGDRLVLRDASAHLTIGGGTVLDVFVPTRSKRSAQRLALLNAQRDRDVTRALQTTLEMETRGIDLSQFAANRNLSVASLQALLSTMPVKSLMTAQGLYACTTAHWLAMQQSVCAALEKFHLREPDNAGVERERLRRVALPTLSSTLFGLLVHPLITDERVVTIDNVFLALPAHRIAFSDAEHRNWQDIARLLQASPFQPPRVRPLAAQLGIDEDGMRRLLGKSARLGLALRVAHDHYFLTTAVRELAAHVLELTEAGGEATVAPFRDRIGTGRKLAVEILEFFNRIGFTRRIQDRHLIRQATMWQP